MSRLSCYVPKYFVDDRNMCVFFFFFFGGGGGGGVQLQALGAIHTYIIELFALCKGGNFNIHIWA